MVLSSVLKSSPVQFLAITATATVCLIWPDFKKNQTETSKKLQKTTKNKVFSVYTATDRNWYFHSIFYIKPVEKHSI